MDDLLPPPYYQHLLMLIKGINIILQQEIPVAELEIAEKHLNTFSHLMANLYGKTKTIFLNYLKFYLVLVRFFFHTTLLD